MRSTLQTFVADYSLLPRGLRDVFQTVAVVLALAGLSCALGGRGIAACICFLALISLTLGLWLTDVHAELLSAQSANTALSVELDRLTKGFNDMATTVADLTTQIDRVEGKVDTALTNAEAAYAAGAAKNTELQSELTAAQGQTEDLQPVADKLNALESKVDDAISKIPAPTQDGNSAASGTQSTGDGSAPVGDGSAPALATITPSF